MKLSTQTAARFSTYSLYVAWVVAVLGISGSLYFSEVLELIPCVLCWYQRVAMYPLSVILLIGMLRKDRDVVWYALPLSIAGLLLAVWHVLLQAQAIGGPFAPCDAVISCTEKQIEFFGWITIPMLSLAGFAVITALLLKHLYFRRKASQLGTQTVNQTPHS